MATNIFIIASSAGMMTIALTLPTFGSAEPVRHCDTAKDAIDKAICTSASARSADDEMVKAYNDLRHTFDSVSAKALLEGQRSWLQTRSKSCSVKGNDVAACLIKFSKFGGSGLLHVDRACPDRGRRGATAKSW
ncbi:lysozyme inhibitor LprI family protein [Methylobacterium sp. CM6244]